MYVHSVSVNYSLARVCNALALWNNAIPSEVIILYIPVSNRSFVISFKTKLNDKCNSFSILNAISRTEMLIGIFTQLFSSVRVYSVRRQL